jgi:formylglycine-generating enzyme required for sulfatase activity
MSHAFANQNSTEPPERASDNAAPDQPGRPGILWIPGGAFLMGSDKHYPKEAPAHKVLVGGFWMDCHTVTNRDFRLFVEATGYQTLAERLANEADYPGGDCGREPASHDRHLTSPIDPTGIGCRHCRR